MGTGNKKEKPERCLLGRLSRREFVACGVALSATTVAGGLLALPRPARGAVPILSTATGTNYKNIVIDAVDGLGGMKLFVTTGDVVVVKPNIGWNSTPQLGGNTHPTVVKTLVELCLDAGASKVKVFDRTCHDARKTYDSSGIMAAVEGLGDSRATISYIDDRKFVSMPIPQGKTLTEWEFYKDVLEADRFINVPVAKNHGSTTLTLSMKNLMGIIGGNRGQIHWSIDQKLADISTLIKPDLIVLDATRVMLRGGPSGGNINNVVVKNHVVAGTDPVAVDSYGTTLFGMKGTDIGHIKAAYDMGLGEIDLSKITVTGA
jgi:uncharacterized protein (DUF362 family)